MSLPDFKNQVQECGEMRAIEITKERGTVSQALTSLRRQVDDNLYYHKLAKEGKIKNTRSANDPSIVAVGDLVVHHEGDNSNSHEDDSIEIYHGQEAEDIKKEFTKCNPTKSESKSTDINTDSLNSRKKEFTKCFSDQEKGSCVIITLKGDQENRDETLAGWVPEQYQTDEPRKFKLGNNENWISWSKIKKGKRKGEFDWVYQNSGERAKIYKGNNEISDISPLDQQEQNQQFLEIHQGEIETSKDNMDPVDFMQRFSEYLHLPYSFTYQLLKKGAEDEYGNCLDMENKEWNSESDKWEVYGGFEVLRKKFQDIDWSELEDLTSIFEIDFQDVNVKIATKMQWFLSLAQILDGERSVANPGFRLRVVELLHQNNVSLNLERNLEKIIEVADKLSSDNVITELDKITTENVMAHWKKQ